MTTLIKCQQCCPKIVQRRHTHRRHGKCQFLAKRIAKTSTRNIWSNNITIDMNEDITNGLDDQMTEDTDYMVKHCGKCQRTLVYGTQGEGLKPRSCTWIPRPMHMYQGGTSSILYRKSLSVFSGCL